MIHSVDATGSTNDDCRARARQGEAEGFWLRADVQGAGRGRNGRTWISPPGNLYASTIVRLGPGDPVAPTLALVAGIALRETVAAMAPGSDPRLKWPNDLMLGYAKLAGILLEGESGAVICGFGVNLAHHPEGLDRPVTSLAAATGTAPDPQAFVERLAADFALWLGHWRSDGLAFIIDAWLARAHPPGTPLAADPGDGARIEGIFDGLDAMGALRLRLADGSVRVIQAGDIFLRQG